MTARPISVRLSEDMIRAMDAHLARPADTRSVATRTDLIQAAIGMWLQADEEARVDAAYVAGYARHRPDPAEWADVIAVSEEAQRGFEPW